MSWKLPAWANPSVGIYDEAFGNSAAGRAAAATLDDTWVSNFSNGAFSPDLFQGGVGTSGTKSFADTSGATYQVDWQVGYINATGPGTPTSTTFVELSSGNVFYGESSRIQAGAPNPFPTEAVLSTNLSSNGGLKAVQLDFSNSTTPITDFGIFVGDLESRPNNGTVSRVLVYDLAGNLIKDEPIIYTGTVLNGTNYTVVEPLGSPSGPSNNDDGDWGDDTTSFISVFANQPIGKVIFHVGDDDHSSSQTGTTEQLGLVGFQLPESPASGGSLDYSDAPADGNTAPDNSGTTGYGNATHIIVSGSQLGTNIDAETAAQNSPGADGDDNGADGDDEDGITIPTLTQSQTATITADVSGAGGYLQGWIDWDGNGSFDAGEQVATDLQDDGTGDDTTAGDGTLTFNVNVPAGAITSADTFARFRWSTTLGLDTTTAASDGEVEDYRIAIASPSTTIVSNPEYTKGCGSGVRIALILDASGSIDGNGGDQDIRDGVRDFINEINTLAPGTQIGIVEFGITSDTPVPFTPVDSTTVNTTFAEYININQNLDDSQKRYDDGRVLSNTNWEAAFREVNLRVGEDLPASFTDSQNPNYPVVSEPILPAEVNPLLTQADAVIFVTDGDPNVFINDDGNLRSATGVEREVNETVPWTNIIKRSGTHIYGFGIAAPGTDLNVLNFAPLTDNAATTEYRLSLNNAESADYAFVEEFADFGRGLVDLARGLCGVEPNLLLAKRITAINPGQSDEVRFNNFVDDGTADNEDNNPNWPQPPNTYLPGAVNILPNQAAVKPGDEIEYTIYFLSDGNIDASDVRICDLIPQNMAFIRNGYTAAGAGITWKNDTDTNTPTQNLSNGDDADKGTFFAPGIAPTAADGSPLCRKPDPDDPDKTVPLDATDNVNGIVVVEIGTLPEANSPGTPPDSYGFIRFRTEVE